MKIKTDLENEISKHRILYLLLGLTLILAFYVRVYRVDQVLGFYYDQGRDALVIWDFWHNGKFFLVGPTTGIAGIFRGPYYYYLIAPLYLLGGGNPVWPAVFLAFTSTVAIAVLYYLGYTIHSRAAGLIGAIIASFSFYIIVASRWLSNPTPMLLLSMILVWMMLLVTKGKRWAWVVIATVAGVSLSSFGSAGEVFYFPALIVFAIWQRKNLPGRAYTFLSLAGLGMAVAPQLLFDIRHDGILRNNVKKFLIEDESFKTNFWDVARARINFYYDVFTNKIFHWRRRLELILLAVTGVSFLLFLPNFLKSTGIKIILLMLSSPLVGLLFFQGNFGNIYDYYLTGYYLMFILLFAIVLGELWKYAPGKVFVVVFFYAFFMVNFEVTKGRLNDGLAGPETIAFGNQKEAIDWIYADANGQEFNTDVYVPPVIPHAYDYLFTWLGSYKYGYTPKEEQIELLYTLYEVDPPHPERLESWLERQAGIGVVVKEARFGGITVQRRHRIGTE